MRMKALRSFSPQFSVNTLVIHLHSGELITSHEITSHEIPSQEAFR